MGYSFGDGVNFPERLYNEDTHTLLGNGTQQWGDETELGSTPPYGSQSVEFDKCNRILVDYRSSIYQMNLVEEATILALGTGTAVIPHAVNANQPLVDATEIV
ncbi:hypothetical protein KPH14_001517 [Odynerus spinipes]|uniref:Uncharacterized protein n=1 Tax=Odynerus spinipes TaxID=1348599 RepID=A0AAD9VTD4_9HYME|nr:hypothetical protein KPH14_001517 [Odynerus spinipes]